MAYGIDLRRRVLRACDSGMKLADVAAKYEVSPSFVDKLLHRRRTTGETGPKEYKRGPKEKLKAFEPRLRELVGRQPDITLAELRTQLKVDVPLSTIWYALDRLCLTFKKNSIRCRAETSRRAGGASRMADAAKQA